MNNIWVRRFMAVLSLSGGIYVMLRGAYWPVILGLSIGLSFGYMVFSFEAVDDSISSLNKSLEKLHFALSELRGSFEHYMQNPPRLEIVKEEHEITIIRRGRNTEQGEESNEGEKTLPPGSE